MKNFARKANVIDRLQDELDGHIWDIFNRYIKLYRINFNYPNDWRICGSVIEFDGSDGCMGCYDPKHISIDMKFFENPDKAFEEVEQEIKAEEKRKKDREAKAKKARELSQLKRLQKKYGKG